MELAVVGALVVKDRLTEKAGHSLPTLMESPAVKPTEFNAPKQVESKASGLKKGANWVISASGGVAINSWAIAEKAKTSDTVAPVRARPPPRRTPTGGGIRRIARLVEIQRTSPVAQT